MHDLLIGLAFVLVIEGLIYGLFPTFAKRMGLELQKIPESNLRTMGVVVMGLGVFCIWLLRR